MGEPRKCTDCGAALTAVDPQPVCPACIFRRLANTGSTMDSAEHASVTAGRQQVKGPLSHGSGRDTDFHSEYELLGEIGRGGMGVIYKAHQARLNRIVALKVIHAASAAGEAARRRFQSEVEVAARLNHPNIVPIFDTGVMDGSPCFSMEYFSGGTLADRLNELTKHPDVGVRLLVKVARAVAFAHQHGVLHRDLKPANILLDDRGEPHVADFGLAKQLDSDSDLTRSGAVIGSPNYMSPEQAAGKSNALTVATDIYSLGVILYQMLTGRTPFAADTPLETMRKVLEEEPAAPSLVRSSRRKEALTDRDLETICLKCLEKEPARRYRTAEDLVDDLERWLRGEPIHARPTTGLERFRKWARRHPALAALSALVILAVVFGVAGVLWQWRNAESARRNETRQLRRAEAALTRLELEKADTAFLANDSRQAIAYLARVLRRDASNVVAGSRLMSVIEQRPFARPAGAPMEFNAIVNSFALSADGSRALFGLFNRSAQLCDATNGMKQLRQVRLPGRMALARFSHDAHHALTITEEGTAQLWDLTLEKPLAEAVSDASTRLTGNPVLLAQFSADDQHAATFSPTTGLRTWDVRAGKVSGSPLAGSSGSIAALSPGAREFALAETNTVQLWSLPAASRSHTLKLSAPVTALAFDAKNQRLAAGDESGRLKLFDIGTGNEILSLAGRSEAIRHLAFAPNGETLVSESGTALAFWKVGDGTPIGEPLPLATRPRQIEFSADGKLLLVRPNENSLALYETAHAQLHLEPLWEASAITDAHFTPDGNRVLVATRTMLVRTWDVQGPAGAKRVLGPDANVFVLTISPDGKTLAAAGANAKVFVWNLATGEPVSESWTAGGVVKRLAFSPDGTRLVAERSNDALRSWNLSNGTNLTFSFNTPIAGWNFLPEPGATIIFALADGSVRRRSLTEKGTAEEIFNLGTEISLARFSDDRRTLVVKQADRKITLWDVDARKKLSALDFRVEVQRFASFSPDGRRGVIPSMDGSAKVWDARTGETVLPPLRHQGAVMQAVFSPDGRVIATASRDFEARLWDAQTGRALTAPLIHRSTVNHVRFTANSKRLVTITRDWAVRVWDIESGLPLSNPLPFSRIGLDEGLAVTPDGKTLAVAGRDRTVRLWSVPDPPGPIPEWLIETAEALAGFRQDDEGIATPIPVERLHALIRQIHSSTATDDFTRWAKTILR